MAYEYTDVAQQGVEFLVSTTKVSVGFRDSNGVAWARRSNGSLTEIPVPS